jgi:hypothetical protein
MARSKSRGGAPGIRDMPLEAEAVVLHTFPVTISAPAVEEEAFKEKALEAAGNAKLVPNERQCAGVRLWH